MEKKIKIAINGLGRIGRASFKIALDNPFLQIVAVNDLGDLPTIVHLLKYDSIYGKWGEEIKIKGSYLEIRGEKILVCSEKDPGKLPWKELDVDIVLESTGVFRDDSAKLHLKAGAKRVIISAPPKSPDIPTYILGVNEDKIDIKKDLVISNSSCTSNCLAPVVKVLDDNFVLDKGVFTTIHAYTNDQKILDLPHKDLRRARAANLNIIPTTTGAATSVIEVLPHLKNRLTGIAIRVPVPIVSLIDFAGVFKKPISRDAINDQFKKASSTQLKGVLDTTEEPLVSSDFKQNRYSSIVDLSLTSVQDNLAKVVAWYDNEWGYSCRYIEMAEYIGKKLIL
ncbi:type I glyceraldehyde-3-phosphate dehydrogenase [bacterium]|nr:type I glyceraldehyde-3-phosphate dehydrogenase [bacterium]